ncbi:unnamed protein product [Trichogramma brassicae]|uniref:Carboxylic ester hydrolase n=1 Tax=Trichogramma brassicae TaxID=86971 RepID=A0A6H5I0K3_9HYME|nr:unnamed protein product [Trichogramma brassicae]
MSFQMDNWNCTCGYGDIPCKMFPFIIILLQVKIILSCDDIVETKLGKIQGFSDTGLLDTEWCSFLGIPFAKPPLGDLRFRDPVPAEPWSDVRKATNYSNFCTQYDIPYKQPGGSEDCLYLNIFTKKIKPDQPRPVMVWIHGGAFNLGSGDNMFYGPDYYMRKDIVLVTLNYRLGIFGFLNLEDKLAPGNQGLKDQVMALKWVRDNIASFGGDPDRVTIFGESAGAASVHYLTLSPMTKGLFRQAIIQSGTALNPWTQKSPNPREYASKVCALLGKNAESPEEILQVLGSADAIELSSLQHKVSEKTMRISDKDLPIIDENIENCLHPYTINLMNEIYHLPISELRRMYFKDDERIDKDTKDKLTDMMGDLSFVEGTHRVARIQLQKSNTPTYLYRYEFDKNFSILKKIAKTKISGASHADDLSSLFRYTGLERLFKLKPLEKGTDGYSLMENMVDMWVNFATYG